MPNQPVPAAVTGLPSAAHPELLDAFLDIDLHLFEAVSRMALLDTVFESTRHFRDDEEGWGMAIIFADALGSIRLAREKYEDARKAMCKRPDAQQEPEA